MASPDPTVESVRLAPEPPFRDENDLPDPATQGMVAGMVATATVNPDQQVNPQVAAYEPVPRVDLLA